MCLSIRRCSACSHEFVHASVHGQSGVNVAARVHADPVDMAALHSCEHPALSIPDADVSGIAAIFLFGDGECAVLAAGDVVWPAHAGPLAEETALRCEYLNALVRPVC